MNSLKSIVSNYLGHLVSYLGSALTIASLIPQAQLSPVARLLIGTASFVVTAAHHGYQAGVGVQAAQAAVDAATKALTSAPAKLVLAVFLVAPLAFLGGCATLAKVDAAITSPSAAPYVAAGVDVAVSVAETKGITAAQINAVAKKVLAADSGAQATLDQLAAVANGEIVKLGLTPLELAAAQVLVSELEIALNAQLQQNASAVAGLAQSQAAVALLLNDVIEATGG